MPAKKRKPSKGHGRVSRAVAWLWKAIAGDPDVRRAAETHANRSAGARKGWETRRNKQMRLDEATENRPD